MLPGGGIYIGIDRDPDAIRAAEPILEEVAKRAGSGEYFLLHGSFADMDALLQSVGLGYVDSFLFDIGLSSPQIDDAGRGFSFKQDAPLDMRFDRSADIPTAADLLATLSEIELVRVFRDYGEEKWASRIARFVVREREKAPITTSGQLVELIKAAIPASARRSGGHPAKRCFQALRIRVNDELNALECGLESAIRWLRPGGRVAVLTFHSLEERVVKRLFFEAERTCDCPPSLPVCVCSQEGSVRVLTRRAIAPSEEEVARNPRARSTKLRVAEKLAIGESSGRDGR